MLYFFRVFKFLIHTFRISVSIIVLLNIDKVLIAFAVYIDARELYNHIPVNKYPGQALVCNLYSKGGIRSVKIGSVMFGKYDDKGKLIPAPMDLVRLAIPRRVYIKSHVDYYSGDF